MPTIMLFSVVVDGETVHILDFVIKSAKISELTEVLWITLPAHLCTFIVILIGTMFTDLSHTCKSDCTPHKCKNIKKKLKVLFIKEFLLVILPPLLITTVFSCNVFYVIIPLTFIIIINLIFLRIAGSNYSTPKYITSSFNSLLNVPIYDSKRSFVTCCRSIIGIMTVISILAVDFKVFPRKFSKSAMYGYSLMDIGVGLFVLSNAGVTKLEKITKSGTKKVILGSLVLFSLGLLRYYLIQQVDYHTNVKEYGVHWNFFFTLGAIKLLSFLVMKMCKVQPLVPGIALGVCHQFCLYYGLEEYGLSEKPRHTLLDANREGLISAVGYTSLYLIGISLNKFLLKDFTTISQDLKTIFKLVLVSTTLFLLTIGLNSCFPVSRRLANLTYITWIMSFALFHISVSMIVELLIICLVSPSSYDKYYNFLTPLIYESINYNGLMFFLVANILTGLVNLLVNTSNTSSAISMAILVGYMVANCTVAFILYSRQIQLKFW